MKQINNLPDKEFKALVIRMVTATQKKKAQNQMASMRKSIKHTKKSLC